MAQDLSGLYISQSFQNLVQTSASGAFNVLATATGTEFIPISASYAISSSHASNADNAISASHAVSADSTSTAISASHAINADSAISASYALTASHAEFADVNLQQVLESGNSASIEMILSASATISSSADTSLEVFGNATVRKNVAGQNATLVIQDDAQNSFTEGPTLQFSGSKVGLIKSDGQTNVRFEFERDFEWAIGSSGVAQFKIVKEAQSAGDFKIEDKGSRSARYIHENINETGSIRFANTTLDTGIAIRTDDGKMALQMYSGSAFVPIIERKINTRQVNLYDSTASTGSADQVLTSNANGGIEWAASSGGGAFPFTGSAQITGSLGVTGSISLGNVDSLNTINPSSQGAFVHGDGNSINSSGEDNGILAGEGNAIQSGGYSAIVGAAASTMNNVDTSVILGGYQNNTQGSRTFTVGGNQLTINNGTDFSGIIGGQSNQINTNVTGSVVLGGKNIAADANDTIFVPALNVGKGSTPGDVVVEAGDVNVTGSIIGSTSILAGQQAGAGSADAVRLGNATTPVQYGNMIIHTNTSGALLGNQYNGFTIDDPGTSNIQLASSAFTGLGNTVHLLSWGANSVGRADQIKLWSSGSGGELNVSTDLIFQAGNKLSMSGSLELAGSVGTAGQVIGVDASGVAKWQAAGGGGGGTQLGGANYIFVSGSGTEAENATELTAALAVGVAATPNGAAKSSTNRFTVVVAPGNYDYTAADLNWNTDYVDFRSLTGEKDVYFSNATYTFQLSANDAKITGINTGLKAFKVATNLANVIVSNCKGGNDSFGTSETISGTYIDCESGGTSFAGNGGTASGTFINCKAEGQNLCFGSLFGASTGVFDNCTVELNFSGYATAQGSYTRCSGLNEFLRNGIGASGRVYNCIAVGNNNYGRATTTDILGQVLNSVCGTNGTGVLAETFPGVGTGGKLVNSIDGNFVVNNIVK